MSFSDPSFLELLALPMQLIKQIQKKFTQKKNRCGNDKIIVATKETPSVVS